MSKKTTKRISVWAALLLALTTLLTAFALWAGSGKTRAFADAEENPLLYIVDCGRVSYQGAPKAGDQVPNGYDPNTTTLEYVGSTKTFVKREGGTFGDIDKDGEKTLTRLLNSYTDKPFSMADPSGKNWGFNEDYTDDISNRFGRGGDYSGGFSEFRSVNDDTVTSERLTYKFEVDGDNALDVTVITCAPEGWGTVNGKMSVNGGEVIPLVAQSGKSNEVRHSIPGCNGVLNSTDSKYYLTLTFGEEGAKTVVCGIIIRNKPNEYNVFYHLGGGENHYANTDTYTHGTGLTLADPTRTGYDFDGWYDAETGGNRVTAISTTQTGNVSLYARWSIVTYTVTYNLDGGTNNDANRATYTYGAGFTLAAPARTGYAFDGWYNATSGGNKVTAISDTQTGNVTLYARWNAIYSITYHLDGGINDAANIATYIQGTGLTLADPTRTGYVFDGWYDAVTGGNKVTAISDTQTGDVTLYARWNAIYSITYNLDGGDNDAANTTTYVQGTGLTLADPTRTGYVFDGWYNAAEGGDKVTAISATQTGDITLYARWNAATYTITYNLDGGSNNGANTATYTYGAGLTLADPTRSGYTFDGWYNAAEGGTKVTAISNTQTGDVTLYARWTKDTATDGGCKSSIGGTAALIAGVLLISAGAGAVVLTRKKKN